MRKTIMLLLLAACAKKDAAAPNLLRADEVAQNTALAAGSSYAADKAELAATPTTAPAPKGMTETGVGGEAYHDWGKNPWVETSKDHLSTFAADVGTFYTGWIEPSHQFHARYLDEQLRKAALLPQTSSEVERFCRLSVRD